MLIHFVVAAVAYAPMAQRYHGHIVKVAAPPRVMPHPVLLLESSSSASSSKPRNAVKLTAKGRRTEIDGSPAGEGGLAAQLLREAKAKTLPNPPLRVQECVDATFYAKVDQIEINALWAAVLAAYGSEERAIAAVESEPYLLNPTYTWPPPLLSRSKAALIEVLGSQEEALEVMRQNPNILQCGAVGILGTGKDEIVLWAKVRDATSSVPKPVAAGLGISFLSLLLLTLAAVRIDDADLQAALAPLLTVSKAVLGLSFALAIEGSRVAIVGAVVKGKMGKQDRDTAAANEAARQRGEERRAKINAESGWAKLGKGLVEQVTTLSR